MPQSALGDVVSAPVIVGLVQIIESVADVNYLPYAIGLLEAYVRGHAADPGRYLFLLPHFRRGVVAQAATQLSLAQIVGFSVYVWNIEYSLALARELKALKPDILIVFGGPQVPDRPDDFLAAHPFIDVCVHGEGERPFLNLLEAWPNSLEGIPGISLRRGDGCISYPRAPRIQDLDEIPSPYLSGVFEPLLLSHPEMRWSVVWETNRGCPFSCSFCDWGSNIAARVARFGDDRLAQELDWFGRRRIAFIYCADANFGMFPRDLALAQALVDVNQRWDYPRQVITQMTKNRPERAFEAHRILWDGGLLASATLSLQSVNPEALAAIRRDNISLPVYHQLLQKFVAAGIPTYTDLLIGLPGETFESFLAGIGTVISQGQHDELRIWESALLPNAEMSQPEFRARYRLETVKMTYFPYYESVVSSRERIPESLELVIATASLSRADWQRCRALSWLVQAFYYSQILQLPIMLAHVCGGVPYAEVLRALLEAPLPPRALVLANLRRFLADKAREVSEGRSEASEMRDPLTGKLVWMPTQTFIAAQLLVSPRLADFYAEAAQVLETLLAQRGAVMPPGLLADGLRFARIAFLAHLPSQRNFRLESGYNLVEAYRQMRLGQMPELKPGRWLIWSGRDAAGRLLPQEKALSPA